MSKTVDYIVKADGWVAGKWRARGAVVKLTAAAAKYENVTLKSAMLVPEVIGVDLAKGESETVVSKPASKTSKRKPRSK